MCRGDADDRTLAEILRHVFAMSTERTLGHIGGDDFIAPFDQPDPLLIPNCNAPWRSFRTLAQHLYRTEDLQRGYL